MITKTILVLWTLLCGVVLYNSINDVAEFATGLVFMQLIVWGVVVVPVALIGLVFKRSRGHDGGNVRVSR